MTPPIRDNSGTGSDGPHYDKICKTNFSNYEAFHDHKVNSKKHITCDICSVDYHSHEALKRHRKELHPFEQSLQCPGCLQIFARLGAWVSHIEQSECEFLKKGKHKFVIKNGDLDKMNQEESRRAMRHLLEYGQTSGDFRDDEQMPKFEDDEEIALTTADKTSLLVNLEDSPRVPLASRVEDGDLLSFDEPSQILNANWGNIDLAYKDHILSLPNNNNTATTAVASTSQLTAVIEPSNAWSVHILSPITTTPPIGGLFPQMESLVIEPQTIWGPHDPENPSFRAGKYYVDILRKFRCPHSGCRKSFATNNAFVQHLASSAHKNNLRLQCNTCHRYFNDATAITQHSEAQGVRCRIRETDGYDAEVYRFTAGTAAATGRLEDNTVKYVMTDTYKLQPASDIANANRATTTAQIEAEMTFWDRNEPVW